MRPGCNPPLSNNIKYQIYVTDVKLATSAGLNAVDCKSKTVTVELMIRLQKATTYDDKSHAYSLIHTNLKCRGINIGFFGAASNVTKAFSWTNYSNFTKDFMQKVSDELVKINYVQYYELAETGRLTKVGGGYITNNEEIDLELVRREQLWVWDLLNKSPYSNFVINEINSRTKAELDGYLAFPKTVLSRTFNAVNQVRNNKRKSNPYAEYNYGSREDRIAVGDLLAKEYRK